MRKKESVATSGGYANEVSDYEESMTAEAGYLIIKLELKQVTTDNFYCP
jgi:hypothetical protein